MRFSTHDELVAIWIAAMSLNSYRQLEQPSILKLLSPLGFRIGSVAFSIVSTQFVASAAVAFRQSQPYAFGRQPRHNSLPSR